MFVDEMWKICLNYFSTCQIKKKVSKVKCFPSNTVLYDQLGICVSLPLLNCYKVIENADK